MIQGVDTQAILHKLNNLIKRYSTGWLLNEIGGVGTADWTNVHLGTDPSQNSNVLHNLDCNLNELMVKIFISSDGTDNNAFEIRYTTHSFDQAAPSAISIFYGLTIFQVDSNNIKIQTGINGLVYILDAGGNASAITAQNWYYNIVVYKLGNFV